MLLHKLVGSGYSPNRLEGYSFRKLLSKIPNKDVCPRPIKGAVAPALYWGQPQHIVLRNKNASRHTSLKGEGRVFRKGSFSEQLQKGVSQGNRVADSRAFSETRWHEVVVEQILRAGEASNFGAGVSIR